MLFVSYNSYNQYIHIKDGIAPSWACSGWLLKMSHNSELQWEFVAFKHDEPSTFNAYLLF